ncbi:MAG: GreA/GreB family elongation factor [Rhodospirillales bacterium]|nr:GreA/GreB family elongation factor [Rhodospirillales bacterium]
MSIAVVRAQSSPLVTIADADFDRLDALASAGELAGHAVAGFLAAELERAVIRPADEIGPNIVRMNSRVAFRIGTRRNIEVRTLVYPEEYAQRGDRGECVSVMTPLGTALLGLRVGTRMSYEAANSTTQYVTVAAVLHQPDTVERVSAGGDGRDILAVPVRESRDHWNDDDPGPAAA